VAASSPPRIALIMSGGGARGAYEAGVVSYLFGDLPTRLGRPVRFDIITGTSVGGVHACYVAGAQQDAQMGERLLGIWRSLSFEKVFAVGPTDLVRVPWQLLGLGRPGGVLPARDGVPERLRGLFATDWLEEIVLRHIAWDDIHRNVEDGALEALAVAATEIATGRSVVFVERRDGEVPAWSHDPFVVPRAARIGPGHALASAAIPLLFPAVRIGRPFYCDGGLRLNTPLAPALRLGADRVLVIGLRHQRTPAEEERIAQHREASFASPAYLAGKALNALLLDRVEVDVQRLRLINALLEAGVGLCGPDFLGRIGEAVGGLGHGPYRIVRDLFLTPSRDLGTLASECLAHQKPSPSLGDWLSRNVARYAGRQTFGEADLLSYLFFDRCYADHLIELGRRDAAAVADELVAFFSPAA
jgi:NTE family protein